MVNRILEHLAVDALRPRERNPRTHSPKQIRQIADSIRQFGFTNVRRLRGRLWQAA